MSVVDWGDVPTWIGGAGALAAGWFAYQTITSQRQQIGEQQAFIAEQMRFMNEQRENLRLERLALEADADDRLRAQARLVVLRPRQESMATVPVSELRWFVDVVNESSEPIRDVRVSFGLLAPLRAEAPGLPLGETTVPVLGAGKLARFYSDQVLEDEINRYPPVAHFTDNAGTPWQLDTVGNLTEDSEP